MSGLFEEYQLLALFDDYKIIDPEVKIGEYSVTYDKKMTFILYVSTYESTAILTLINNDTNNIIFNIGIKKLEKIICKEEKLFFFKERSLQQPILTIQIKPMISLDCDL